jgi:O-acetyl-ADP-ribose deacetylase (regulator of RNase III)
MPFEIVRNDITKMKVDGIVNAANTALKMGGGVCGAIFKAAGADKLQAACNNLGPIKTGEAVITDGFNLPAKYIIHTAGPVYKDGKHGEAELLRACYINSLALAQKTGCESIAFPLISSGIYGYPKAEALKIAASSIVSFLLSSDMHVYLVVFDKEAIVLSEKLLGEVRTSE